MRRPALFTLCIGLCTVAPAATVYKSVDEHGNVVYTDSPGGQARPVDLPPLSTYPAPKLPPRDAGTADAARDIASSPGYNALTVTQPAPDATVRDNAGSVEVRAAVEPALMADAGHRFRFYLDGKPVGEPVRVPNTRFSNINRGAHQVEVAVVDAAGNELRRSDSVRFYLHRQSQNMPYGPKPRSAPPAN